MLKKTRTLTLSITLFIMTALVPGPPAQSQVPLYDPPLMALSPQGDKLAIAVRGRSDQESRLTVYDVVTGSTVSSAAVTEGIWSLDWSLDNLYVATGGLGFFHIRSASDVGTIDSDISEAVELAIGKDQYVVSAIAWSIDGSQLAFVVGARIMILSTANSQLETNLDGSYTTFFGELDFWGGILHLEWRSPSELIFSTIEGTTYVYSLAEQKITRYFQPFLVTLYSPQVTGTVLSHSRTRYAVAERYANRIYIWDIESNVGVEDDYWAEPNSTVFEGYGAVDVQAIAWRHDDAVVASLSEDFKLRFWDPNTGQQYAETTLPPDASTNQIVWSADGSEVLYVTMDAELESVPVSGLSVPPPSTPAPAPTQPGGDG